MTTTGKGDEEIAMTEPTRQESCSQWKFLYRQRHVVRLIVLKEQNAWFKKQIFGKKSEKSRIVAGLMKESKENLEEIARMIAEGKLKGVVDKLFTLQEIAVAHKYAEQGKKVGNIGIIVSE